MNEKRNEILKNCINNKKEAENKLINETSDRILKIIEEAQKKDHYYQDLYDQMFEKFPTMSLDYNPDKEINWCETCENTTLTDCLSCVNGSKNPKYYGTDKSKTIDTETVEDKVSILEDKFLKAVKSAKTKDLEKIFDVIDKELFNRYLNQEELNKYKENSEMEKHNCNCDKCENSCQDNVLLYHEINGKPVNVTTLSKSDFDNINNQVRKMMREEIKNYFKSLDLYRFKI